MFVASLLVLPLALTEIFFVPDYWKPDAVVNAKLSIEDFIFTFAIGGIIAVLYELFLARKFVHKKLCDCFGGEFSHAVTLMVSLIIVFILYFVFKLNFMYAVYFGIAFDLLIISLTRKDLIKDMLMTSFLFGVLYFLFFVFFIRIFPGFIGHWNFEHLSGILILGVPLEEIVWAFGIGALIGPIYEYILSVKLVKL